MKINDFVTNCIKAISIIFHAEPKLLVKQSIFAVMHGLSWVLQVVSLQYFFDMSDALIRQETTLFNCFLAMLGMLLSYAFTQIMNGVDNCHANILNLAVSKYINIQIFKRVSRLKYADFEDQKRLDYIEKAKNGGENVVWFGLTLIDTVFFYTTYFISMGYYLFLMKPILGFCILAVFIPCILSDMVQTKVFQELEDNAAPVRRECQYYEECVCDAKETRFLGATQFFEKLYETKLKLLNKLVLKAQLKKSIITLIGDAITVIGYGIILVLLFIYVMKQEISIGVFAAVLASMNAMFNFMNEIISERLSWAYENVVTLNNYVNFIEETPVETILVEPKNNSIVFEDVSFRYPYAENDALNKINLKIEHGETVAIVGENGSGKSTLCRLILGQLTPTEGNLLMGDCPIDKISHKKDSAIFQNYNHYKMTLKDNITISQTDKNVSDNAIMDLCSESGVNISEKDYLQGLDTMLGREFDGVELSGGQWQRIAIARGLYRDSELIVLDEPTSAIDPLEETRLYQDFSKICQNKTAVLVTHRLGSTKIADKIVVLKAGMVVEVGSHAELMKKNGEYTRLFDCQSHWYL